MEKTAELAFEHGRQMVRLPEGVTLSGDKAIVHQNAQTGEITLLPHDKEFSRRNKDWEEFFKLRDQLSQEELDAFVIPRNPAPPKPRDIF